jgi:hypothetical protein
MSKTIPIAKGSPRKDTAQSPKLLLATGILTAVTTLGVSFIGIVPQLRRGDTDKLEVLTREVNQLKTNTVVTPTPAPPVKKMTVHGTVKTEDGAHSLSGAEVFLLPMDNNPLTAKTDDSGTFNFKDIPAGTYSIIVRESVDGKSSKILLDGNDDRNDDDSWLSLRLLGAKVKYHIR